MKAILVNKSVLFLMSLTIFVTLVSGNLFDKTKVTVTNTLGTPVLMECKDALTNDGAHMLLPGENHRFKFYQSPLLTYIWSCKFEWKGASHMYNIYDSRRDECYHYNCYWLIKEEGPCQIVNDYNNTPVCFSWNY
ncbi:putative plant self-incompatibility S1 [Lupinus albus]|uniref:S-protein homolog n=1 Tax=Lupinus albus TaxID=3870 RepID=A0A6A4QF66_LUPAL|nr:putative plant self-incompatibility S1 [Lupinus albus]